MEIINCQPSNVVNIRWLASFVCLRCSLCLLCYPTNTGGVGELGGPESLGRLCSVFRPSHPFVIGAVALRGGGRSTASRAEHARLAGRSAEADCAGPAAKGKEKATKHGNKLPAGRTPQTRIHKMGCRARIVNTENVFNI